MPSCERALRSIARTFRVSTAPRRLDAPPGPRRHPRAALRCPSRELRGPTCVLSPTVATYDLTRPPSHPSPSAPTPAGSPPARRPPAPRPAFTPGFRVSASPPCSVGVACSKQPPPWAPPRTPPSPPSLPSAPHSPSASRAPFASSTAAAGLASGHRAGDWPPGSKKASALAPRHLARALLHGSSKRSPALPRCADRFRKRLSTNLRSCLATSGGGRATATAAAGRRRRRQRGAEAARPTRSARPCRSS